MIISKPSLWKRRKLALIKTKEDQRKVVGQRKVADLAGALEAIASASHPK